MHCRFFKFINLQGFIGAQVVLTFLECPSRTLKLQRALNVFVEETKLQRALNVFC